MSINLSTVIKPDPVTLEERMAQWTVVRDCLEGDQRIKQKGVTYLPRPSGMRAAEGDDPYDAYKLRAEFFNVAERTLRGLLGMVFRVPPSFDVPPVLEPRLEGMTPEGLPAPALARDVVRSLLSVGRYGLLVDMPRDGGARPLPYVAAYAPENIVDWTEEYTDGVMRVTKVDIRVGEEQTPTADEKQTKLTEKILRLVLNEAGVYEQHRFERPQGGQEPSGEVEVVTPMVRGQALREIPFRFVNPYNLKPAVEKPPMYDLCMVNLAHYRNSACYEHTLYMAGNPTPCFSGVSEAEESRIDSLGPLALYTFRSPEAKGWFMEFEGKASGAMRQAMMDKQDRMAALGARMIQENKRAAESADKARLDSQTETSLVMAVVDTSEQAMTWALRTMAEWASANPNDVQVTFNREFIEVVMPPQEVLQLVASWQQGAFSRDVLWWNLKRGGRVPHDRTMDEDDEIREDEGSGTRFTPPPGTDEGETPAQEPEENEQKAA